MLYSVVASNDVIAKQRVFGSVVKQYEIPSMTYYSSSKATPGGKKKKSSVVIKGAYNKSLLF